MFEVDWVDELDGAGVCAAASSAHTAMLAAEFTQAALAVQWLILHNGDTLTPAAGPDGRVLPGTEKAKPAGADGTPTVGEFAATEYGALLGMGYHAADAYLRDIANLYYRHPRLWTALKAGRVRVWQARKIAADTAAAGLTLAQAQAVDAALAGHLGSLGWGRLLDLLAAKIIAADPDAAEARAKAKAMERFVRTGSCNEYGLKTIYAQAAAGDIIFLVAMIDRIAAILADGGDTDPIGARRSKALGILATPARALHMLHQAATTSSNPDADDPDSDSNSGNGDDTDPADDADGDGGDDPNGGDGGVVSERDVHPAANDADDPPPTRHRCPTCRGQGTLTWDPSAFVKPPPVDPAELLPNATVYLHLSDLALTSGTGVARMEDVGPITLGQVTEFLGHCNVTVKPVIDLTRERAVDCYEAPDWMREMVHLLRPVEVFPHGTNTSRTVDLDHPVGYVPRDRGGPPGQTTSHTLGPLGRFPHRIRTHGRWRLHQPHPGVWIWTSPHGYRYRFDRHGTHLLGHTPPGPVEEIPDPTNGIDLTGDPDPPDASVPDE